MIVCKGCVFDFGWKPSDTSVPDECIGCVVVGGKPTNFKPKPKTNADRIRAMTDEELAKWIASIAFARETPWCAQFLEKFCISCPSEMYKIKETGQVLRLHECDFKDSECPHGNDIVWWLQQPAKEE